MTPNAPHIFNQQEPRVTFIGIGEIGDSHESKREQGALDAYKHMLDGLQAL